MPMLPPVTDDVADAMFASGLFGHNEPAFRRWMSFTEAKYFAQAFTTPRSEDPSRDLTLIETTDMPRKAEDIERSYNKHVEFLAKRQARREVVTHFVSPVQRVLTWFKDPRPGSFFAVMGMILIVFGTMGSSVGVIGALSVMIDPAPSMSEMQIEQRIEGMKRSAGSGAYFGQANAEAHARYVLAHPRQHDFLGDIKGGLWIVLFGFVIRRAALVSLGRKKAFVSIDIYRKDIEVSLAI